MIRVRFKTAGGLICGFTLSGHAGAGASGQDIVCAAVSILVYVQMRLWEKAGVLEEFRAGEGYARLTARRGSGAAPEVLALGLRYLAAEYPVCVQVQNG